MTNSLPTAELAIYAALSLPTIFILIRHLPTGLHGWFFLLSFCTIRIIGGALAMKDDTSKAANIISNVGLSPLLFAASGILHEARKYRSTTLGKGCELAFFLGFHILVSTGIALVAVGSSALEDGGSSNNLSLLDCGIGLITASWVILAIWALCSIHTAAGVEINRTHQPGTLLLYSVFISIPLIGVRVLYSLIYLTTRKPYLNPVTGSLDARVVLGFLPELLAVLSFIVAGIKTRNATSKRKLGLNVG